VSTTIVPPKDVQIDPRGYRLGAGLTAVIAIVALTLGAGFAGSITMTVLAAMFLPGAAIGPQATIQSYLFRTLVSPRIGAPVTTESFRPPRFAQLVGLVFAVLAAVLGFAGITAGFYVFAGFVLAASFLNSVFGFCLGCETYLLLTRLGSPRAA